VRKTSTVLEPQWAYSDLFFQKLVLRPQTCGFFLRQLQSQLHFLLLLFLWQHQRAHACFSLSIYQQVNSIGIQYVVRSQEHCANVQCFRTRVDGGLMNTVALSDLANPPVEVGCVLPCVAKDDLTCGDSCCVCCTATGVRGAACDMACSACSLSSRLRLVISRLKPGIMSHITLDQYVAPNEYSGVTSSRTQIVVHGHDHIKQLAMHGVARSDAVRTCCCERLV